MALNGDGKRHCVRLKGQESVLIRRTTRSSRNALAIETRIF